jgi:hypothetical protein
MHARSGTVVLIEESTPPPPDLVATRVVSVRHPRRSKDGKRREPLGSIGTGNVACDQNDPHLLTGGSFFIGTAADDGECGGRGLLLRILQRKKSVGYLQCSICPVKTGQFGLRIAYRRQLGGRTGSWHTRDAMQDEGLAARIRKRPFLRNSNFPAQSSSSTWNWEGEIWNPETTQLGS